MLLAASRPETSILDKPALSVQTLEAVSQAAAEGPGTVIGPYQLTEQIGEGGFGVVFRAQQRQPIRREVAFKTIKPGMDTRQVVARFETERQALALMEHPHIARVLDGGVTSTGRPYFVMELVPGIPITQYCDEHQLTPRERLALFVPVCQAVQHAHQKGIIHRDLKPSNVLVAEQDGIPVPKVIDFGVAKALGSAEGGQLERSLATGLGRIIGTLEYMSPEQAEFHSSDVDTRADIYSLGVLLYELLTGTTPLTKDRLKQAAVTELLRVIREEEPPRPSTRLADSKDMLASVSAQRNLEPARLTRTIRGELDWIVMKCLEKDRNRRYATANALASDIQRYLHDEPVEASPPSAYYQLRKFLRRNRGPALVAGLLLLMLLGGTTGTTIGMIRAEQQRQRAEDAANAERQAKVDAEQRLTQLRNVNEILASIFRNLDPMTEEKENKPLVALIGEQLDEAARQLEGEAVGDPITVAKLQKTLAQALLGLGYPQKAIPLLDQARKTLALQENPDNLDTLLAMYELAEAYRKVGKPELAIPILQETFQRASKEFGPQHKNSISCRNHLAFALQETGKTAEAIAIFEDTLQQFTRVLGQNHERTLDAMNSLALAYDLAGQEDLAIPLYERALGVVKEKFGADHPATISVIANLASAYQKAGKLDQSISMFEVAAKLFTRKLGDRHPRTLATMSNLASAYSEAGQTERAISLFEETLRLNKERLGPSHPSVYTTMWNLANALNARGTTDRQDAELAMYEQAAAGIERLDFRHEYADSILRDLSLAYEKRNEHDHAEVWWRKRLQVVENKFGTRSAEYASALLSLGTSLVTQRKWAEAEALLKKAYEIQHERISTNPEDRAAQIEQVIDQLVQLYEKWGKPDEAEKWRKRVEK